MSDVVPVASGIGVITADGGRESVTDRFPNAQLAAHYVLADLLGHSQGRGGTPAYQSPDAVARDLQRFLAEQTNEQPSLAAGAAEVDHAEGADRMPERLAALILRWQSVVSEDRVDWAQREASKPPARRETFGFEDSGSGWGSLQPEQGSITDNTKQSGLGSRGAGDVSRSSRSESTNDSDDDGDGQADLFRQWEDYDNTLDEYGVDVGEEPEDSGRDARREAREEARRRREFRRGLPPEDQRQTDLTGEEAEMPKELADNIRRAERRRRREGDTGLDDYEQADLTEGERAVEDLIDDDEDDDDGRTDGGGRRGRR